jgi:hypothetical protein
MIVISLSALIELHAQSEFPKGKVKVMATKGKVFFNGVLLKKADIIDFSTSISAVNQLVFTSPTAWVKVVEGSTRKIYHFYKLKKYACANCLWTKGGDNNFNNDMDLMSFFMQKTILLFDTDTLILRGTSIKSDSITVPVFQFVINGNLHNKIVGRNDTIIISHDQLFEFTGIEKLPDSSFIIASFLVDSIRLIYYNQKDKLLINPRLPYFRIVFFKDVVNFLNKIGLNEEEIYGEMITNFVKLSIIMKNENLRNSHEAEKWLRKEIHLVVSNKDS